MLTPATQCPDDDFRSSAKNRSHHCWRPICAEFSHSLAATVLTAFVLLVVCTASREMKPLLSFQLLIVAVVVDGCRSLLLLLCRDMIGVMKMVGDWGRPDMFA